jgi:hypothetical protein
MRSTCLRSHAHRRRNVHHGNQHAPAATTNPPSPSHTPRVPPITRRGPAKSCPKAVTLPCSLTRFARVFTAADAFRCAGERRREFRTLNGELAVALCPRSAIRRFRIRGTVPCACRPLLNSGTTRCAVDVDSLVTMRARPSGTAPVATSLEECAEQGCTCDRCQPRRRGHANG